MFLTGQAESFVPVSSPTPSRQKYFPTKWNPSYPPILKCEETNIQRRWHFTSLHRRFPGSASTRCHLYPFPTPPQHTDASRTEKPGSRGRWSPLDNRPCTGRVVVMSGVRERVGENGRVEKRVWSPPHEMNCNSRPQIFPSICSLSYITVIKAV